MMLPPPPSSPSTSTAGSVWVEKKVLLLALLSTPLAWIAPLHQGTVGDDGSSKEVMGGGLHAQEGCFLLLLLPQAHLGKGTALRPTLPAEGKARK